MNNIPESKWELLSTQLRLVADIEGHLRNQRHGAILEFLYEHTEQNPCFTETVVTPSTGRPDTRKMMYSIYSEGQSQTYFDAAKHPPALYRKMDIQHKGFGSYIFAPIVIECNDLLDEPTMIELIQKKVGSGDQEPEIFIPKGCVAFRFQAQWAAGGYDDPPVIKKLVFEADSLEEGFEKLKVLLRSSQRENFFGNFSAGLPGLEKWQRIVVEPEHANLGMLSQLQIRELKLAESELH